MKIILSLISISILLNACLIARQEIRKADQKTITQEANQLEWLIGKWQRTNDLPGQMTTENWARERNSYFGEAQTMKDGEHVFSENLKLYRKNSHWIYLVIGVNEKPTAFQLTTFTANKFHCENRKNDFPKSISYVYKNGQIEAIIADGKREIIFKYEKSLTH